MRPESDIRLIDIDSMPAHDVLCAGFPCQLFSKTGEQNGFKCPRWGNLFEHALRIARRHEREYIILENVPNLKKYDGGRILCQQLWGGRRVRCVCDSTIA